MSDCSGLHPAADLDPRGYLGTVRAVQANYYRVVLDTLPENVALAVLPPQSGERPELLCVRRSRLKKTGQQVITGDRVVVVEPDWSSGRAAIVDVLPRRTWLPRPAIANVGQALIVCALAEPEPDPLHLSRLLVQAEACELVVQICLNKSDLVSAARVNSWRARLKSWGYEPLVLSAETGRGLDELQAVCRDRISVMAGGSGMGKSSLLNALLPDVSLRTQPVSGRLQHGRHTTRHVELFAMPSGGWLADTPGFNQVELLRCRSEGLARCFPEARSYIAHCQFPNCRHQQEPGCEVRAHDWERFDHYLSFYAEISAREAAERDLPAPDAAVKYKTTRDGRTAEPRLDSRYRRQSRRSRRQSVQAYRGDDLEALLQAEQAEDWS
ncbi:MAG: ribosome small subunit-dependent GTPase A [Cyanobacteria bacterium P01_D01_bin.123]